MTSMHLEQITSRLLFARTEHANWTIYRGPDGVVLLDSGYLWQRDELEESLRRVGRSPAVVDAVLVTHGHADHLGGASWLATEYGVPVAETVPLTPRPNGHNLAYLVTKRDRMGHVLPGLPDLDDLAHDLEETPR